MPAGPRSDAAFYISVSSPARGSTCNRHMVITCRKSPYVCRCSTPPVGLTGHFHLAKLRHSP